MGRRASDIVPGARIVVGRMVHYASRDLSDIVAEFDAVVVRQDDRGLFFVNRTGARRDFVPERDPYSASRLRMPGEVMWTLPVPEASNEELCRLVAGTVGSPRDRSGQKPLLLHVQSVNGDVAYALPVLPRGDDRNERSLQPRYDAAPDYEVGNAAIWAHMMRITRRVEDWALRPGALVVAWMGMAHIADGLPVHQIRHMIEILRCSVERLGEWLPASLSPLGYHNGPFHDVLEIEEEEVRARVRLEPSEALVMGYLDGDTRGGRLLGTSGITYHHADDALSSMFGADDPPLGLWVAKDARWTGEGEDVEIDFDLVPATMADVERFGWSAESLRTEIAGDLDVSVDRVPDDICTQILAQASEVHALERWKDAIGAAWDEKSGQLSNGSLASYEMRYPLRDFMSMARSHLCAIDGLDLAVADDSISLRWPEASVEALANGEIVVTLANDVVSYPRNGSVSRKDMFQPVIDWLTTRPEHTNRERPDDPRTVAPVSDEE